MSGPVWKLLKLNGACDSCGEKVDELLAVGTVVDFEFTPDYRFCRVCYDRYKGRRDELDPAAIADAKTPRLISRPSSESDLEG